MLWVPVGMAVIMVVAALWLGEPIFSVPFLGMAAIAFGLRFVLQVIRACRSNGVKSNDPASAPLTARAESPSV